LAEYWHYNGLDMTPYKIIPVTQADRDAAARYAMAATDASMRDKEIQDCVNGILDATYLVQSFAHHRVDSISALLDSRTAAS